jgi:hypothetical protein
MSAYFPFTFNNGTGIKVTRDGNNINFEDSVRYQTGWGCYRDSLYTEGSPFAIASGVTDTITNNADSIDQINLPTGVTSFYSALTNKILPERAWDVYNITILFRAKCDVAIGGSMTVGLRTAGASVNAIEHTYPFVKGANTEQRFNCSFTLFIAPLAVANGGYVMVSADNGNVQIYRTTYIITRIHRGH